MTIYEITATVDPGLTDSFEEFMSERHMPDLVKTGYFESAEMILTDEGQYKIEYRCQSRELLEEYLRIDAKKLRAIFVSEFPAGVSIERKIIEEETPNPN
jgi:hypothetical protein